MRGFLLREQALTPGTDTFIECVSEENNFAVVFEDDTDTGYFYALELDPEKGTQRILDALHIYQVEEEEKPAAGMLQIIWSTDWLKCALVINNKCQAVFDFENQAGYNRSEFPPPNETWTKQERTLREDVIKEMFK